MSIARYENITINNLTYGKDSFGEYTETSSVWFETRPLVMDVRNNLAIMERYRIYQDLIAFKFNYTPNLKTIVDHQQSYSITWRGHEWRITDALEANDRMTVTLMCYRNDPETKV